MQFGTFKVLNDAFSMHLNNHFPNYVFIPMNYFARYDRSGVFNYLYYWSGIVNSNIFYCYTSKHSRTPCKAILIKWIILNYLYSLLQVSQQHFTKVFLLCLELKVIKWTNLSIQLGRDYYLIFKILLLPYLMQCSHSFNSRNWFSKWKYDNLSTKSKH